MKTLLLAFLLPLQANACLWVDGTTIDGGHRTIGGLPSAMLRHAMESTPEERIDRIIRAEKVGQRDDFSQTELEGAEEILKGRYDRAVEIFEKAEATQPGRYSTAVNLGTAYELNGELEPALRWIREGLRRNPDSHDGTEWLHVEILRTRLKLKEDPAYLKNHHIVSLPETFSDETPVPTGEGTHTAEEIGGSILYQLEERLVFVKPPDPVVADLLYTLGVIEGRTNIVESGRGLMGLASEYGFARPDLITKRLEQYERAILYGKIKRVAYIVLAVMTFILFLIFAWRKKWFFLSRAAYLKDRKDKHLHPEI